MEEVFRNRETRTDLHCLVVEVLAPKMNFGSRI